MPLYEYQCTACGQRIEVVQRFSAAPLQECPQCGGRLNKLISAPALQFKGSGFYLTDYGRSGGRKAESSSDKGDAPKSEAPASESKPAADSKPAASTDKKAS